MSVMGGGREPSPMPDWLRRILLEKRDILTKDLDVTFISSVLVQENVLTADMSELVKSKPSRMQCTEAFLDLLPSRGEKAFRVFVDSLEETYPHLCTILETAYKHELRKQKESAIYEDLADCHFSNDDYYMTPTPGASLTQFDHPTSYTTPLQVYQSGDSGERSKEIHPTVVVAADVTAEVLEKIGRPGNVYHASAATSSEVLHSIDESQGATASLNSTNTNSQMPRIGNFIRTGNMVSLRKGSIAFVHNYFQQQDLAIVMDKKLRFVCIPMSAVKEDGNPEGEKWFSSMALAPTQAEQMLKDEAEGCFVVYTPTYDSDITPYELSMKSLDGTVRHYPIYKYDHGQIGFRDEEKRFKNLRDLVEYHKGNRALLDTRLKRAQGETEERSLEDLEIDPSDVNVEEQRELGSGCFSVYYQGMHKNKIVTIKKPKSDSRCTAAILEEASVLSKLKHDHVIRMLGVIRPEEPCLVLESLHDGDLSWWLEKAGSSIDGRVRLDICYQVALAVKYLHEQRWVIHRDIAAHSCQVTNVNDSDVLIKLSDFTMSRRVMDDEYKAEKGEKVAKRWAAPEVLLEGRYSTKSDVWALGVLIWEVYSGGQKPFSTIEKQEVEHLVTKCKHSVTTSQPIIPTEMNELIELCCEPAAADRPSASFVCDELSALRDGFEHRHVQPVDHGSALRQTLSYVDVRTLDRGHSSGERTGSSEKRKGFLSRLSRKK